MWILVTGYGPFGGIEDNPSWKTVNLLPPSLTMANDRGQLETYKIHKHYLRVSYTDVDDLYSNKLAEIIQTQYDGEEPSLIVHVGVNSGVLKSVNIEERAYNFTQGLDIDGKIPSSRLIDDQKPVNHVLKTKIERVEDVARIITKLMRQPVQRSTDPGRFLCNYVYYKALTYGKSKAIFIHVPMENNTWTVDKMRECLEMVCEYSIHEPNRLSSKYLRCASPLTFVLTVSLCYLYQTIIKLTAKHGK